MVRALLLVLAAIGAGLGGSYLIRAALLNIGGFKIGSATTWLQLRRLVRESRFWAGAALIGALLLLSLDLYSREDLSKVVPLYSLSYVLVALIGKVFLNEQVTLKRWAGIFTIVTGVVLLLTS